MHGTEHIARREREILARLWLDVLRLAHKTHLPDVRFGSAVRLMLIYLGRGHIDPSTEIQTRELQSAAHARGQPIQIFTAGSERELDVAFESMRQLRVGALLVGSDVFFSSRRAQIVTLAARHSVPAVYEQRAFVDLGGLMSYGTNIAEGYRQAGRYTGRILKGEKPANIPVLQLSREALINAKMRSFAVQANVFLVKAGSSQ
jgi:ABC-type uncharacterized transport system substrate-binding protein